MRGWRFFLGDLLICLPLFVSVAGCAFLFVRTLPMLEANESARVRLAYRTIATSVKEGEAKYIREYNLNDRKSWGRFSQGSWGVDDYRNGKLVWYRQPRASKIKGVVVDAIPAFDYRGFFLWIGGAALFLMLLLTNVGLRFFRRFTKERDDFLSAVAHDLTTPLVGMRMMIGRNDEEAKRLNERMLLIVSNIKDYLKLGGRRRKPDLKQVDVVALAKEAYELFAADYEDSEGGEVEFEVQGEGPRPTEEGNLHSSPSSSVFALIALADETMALQILWNLFGNDLKYAAPYGKVTVKFARAGDFITVEFADEGPGMTPRQMKLAFDRYYRARTVLESGKGGFGIGLCTAREFARAMGGDLTVRANNPKGCVFALLLPTSPNP